MAGFSIESLEKGIEACKKNIGTFEDAIQKEKDTIQEYRDMIFDSKRKAQEREDNVIRLEAERED